ncbi:MAG: aminoacyl-tRNA hydrolase [Pseudomonadota bacterium]
MWLLVGLGNPGDKYEKNRHNIGFMIADTIASEYGFGSFKSKFEGEYAQGTIAGQKCLLLKPMTYMNDSGISVSKLAKFYKIDTEQIIVFYDELDLPPGKLRVKKGGGAGGHNGIKSIDNHMKSKDYWRVRMGIGHPGDKNRVSGYVLNDFPKEQQKWLPDWIDAISDQVSYLVQEKHEDFMTQVARKFKAPVAEKKEG